MLLQLEGDTITLKPRPSADLTNSGAPSPSHKVQRSVSANPKQRRFSDQGAYLGVAGGDSPSPHSFGDLFLPLFSPCVAWPLGGHLAFLHLWVMGVAGLLERL